MLIKRRNTSLVNQMLVFRKLNVIAEPLFSAISEAYEIFVRDSFGVVGNDVLVKCDVPFNTFVAVTAWVVLSYGRPELAVEQDRHGSACKAFRITKCSSSNIYQIGNLSQMGIQNIHFHQV